MKKILFVLVLIFCIFGTTQTAYAYFDKDSIQVINEDGELYKLEETYSNNEYNLIPQDTVLGINDTYTLTYIYEIYVEDGVSITSNIENLQWGDYLLSESESNEIYTFEIDVQSIKDVTISNGLFTDNTNGELLEISVNITMNDCEDLHVIMTNFSDILTFDYILNVSKS